MSDKKDVTRVVLDDGKTVSDITHMCHVGEPIDLNPALQEKVVGAYEGKLADKGVVIHTIPADQMPFAEDGSPLDFECHLDSVTFADLKAMAGDINVEDAYPGKRDGLRKALDYVFNRDNIWNVEQYCNRKVSGTLIESIGPSVSPDVEFNFNMQYTLGNACLKGMIGPMAFLVLSKFSADSRAWVWVGDNVSELNTDNPQNFYINSAVPETVYVSLMSRLKFYLEREQRLSNKEDK